MRRKTDMTFGNRGYIGYSMSVRAAEAYQSGEKPLSKWTKADILHEVGELYGADAKKAFAAFPVKILRGVLLSVGSWHHTSSYYNRTDFYYLPDRDAEEIELSLRECRERAEAAKRREAEPEETPRRARCIYLEWGGTRKHPKATEVEAVGAIRAGWFFPDGESFKKSINANGFKVLEFLD